VVVVVVVVVGAVDVVVGAAGALGCGVLSQPSAGAADWPRSPHAVSPATRTTKAVAARKCATSEREYMDAVQ